jgi:hypothetical protein
LRCVIVGGLVNSCIGILSGEVKTV